jgi:hypothetical protein
VHARREIRHAPRVHLAKHDHVYTRPDRPSHLGQNEFTGPHLLSGEQHNILAATDELGKILDVIKSIHIEKYLNALDATHKGLFDACDLVLAVLLRM